MAITNGSLMITTHVVLLEQIMRGESDRATLADSTDYRRISRHFPDRTSLLTFDKGDAQVEALYELVQSGAFGEIVPGVDLTKLPKFELIRKYLPSSGGYAVPDANGALFVSFSLKPQE
jgi:hypothetical protein